MKKFLICLSILFSFLFIGNVKAATSHSIISSDNYNIDNLNFTYNGYTYNKTTIYNKITNYLTNNTNYTLSDFKYIFIGVPNSKSTNYSNSLGSIYIDLFGSDFNPSSFSVGGAAYSVWYSDIGSSLSQHFKIHFSDDSIEDYSHLGGSGLLSMFSGTSSSYMNTYTNYSIDLSMINNDSSYSDYIHFYIGNMGYNFKQYNNPLTVNFHLNGGSVWDMSNILDPHLITEDFSIESTTDELSEYLTHLTPIKPYSNFIGWYYDSEFTEPYSSINNLLDISQGYQNGYISSSNEFKSHPQTALFNQKIYLESGKTYTFSTKSNVCNMVISLYDSNDNFLGRTKKENTNNIVYTAGNNVSYVRFAVNIDDDTITEQKINNAEIIVEEGSTRTEISNVISNDINLYAKFELYDYLQGYTQINLESGERYVIFSSSTISSGSVYIPISDFNNYGSRISYFDKDLDTQPYTSYIQDFSTTSDGLFAKQDFDLSSYSGSDFIMFSKYIYLEGPDDFSSSVWVPDSMYSSIVEVTPNNIGGNDFDFSYVDSDGELQADVISSSDLSQGSPLVSDLFTNFTTKDYGLSSIITAPIPLLQTLNNTSCSTVDLPLGIFGGVHDRKLSLPCMTSVYSSVFGELFTLYQTISSGVVAYFIGLAYFNKIKQFKDPENDSIEVVNL